MEKSRDLSKHLKAEGAPVMQGKEILLGKLVMSLKVFNHVGRLPSFGRYCMGRTELELVGS